jgi:protein-disulfide isomerase
MKGTQSDVRFLLVLLAASLGGNVFLFHRLSNAASPRARVPSIAELKDGLARQPRHAMPIPSEGAQVVVVKFSDYQCPPCRTTHEAYAPVLARLQATHPGAVRFVVKDFPLASECNAAVTASLHPAACEAAVAVRLARRMGKQDELADWLFAHQASLTADAVRAASRSITGRDYSQSDYEAALAEVKEDAALGATLGIQGTPAVFVNGLLLDPPTPELFEVAIEYELSRSGRRANR